MGHFLSELAMTSDVDLWDPRADAISLLTLHASKGLEFPVVFIVGCEDGLLPLRWGTADDRDTSEERRLFFVGMTRARRRLFLSHARKRLWMGKLRDMDPSPFLKDIQEQLLERHRAESHRQSRPSHQQLDLF
jgi:DNA helicase-2/ATP-dependent DNA helicase PcrA